MSETAETSSGHAGDTAPTGADLAFVLFATPRTASTQICTMLGQYFYRTLGYAGRDLSEYFNTVHTGVIKGNDGLWLYFNSAHLTTLDSRDELLRRKALLADEPRAYLFKFFPLNLTKAPELFDWINETRRFICLERRDRVDQVLSWIIAQQTKVFFQLPNEPDLEIPPGSIIVQESNVANMIQEIRNYDTLKASIRHLWATIYYEDFLNVASFDDLARVCKLPPCGEIPYFRLKRMTYKRGKLDLLANPDAVMAWIEKYGPL